MSGAAGRKRKAAAAAPAPALPQVFEGCRLFFLQRGHLGIMMKRVVQVGEWAGGCGCLGSVAAAAAKGGRGRVFA